MAIKHRNWSAVLLAAFATVLISPAATANWGGSLGATTDYVFRGITQSAGDPSVQADVHDYTDSGWLLGLWGASVKRDSDNTTAELNAYIGRVWSFADDWSVRLNAIHYDYPDNTPTQLYDYDELEGTLAYRDLVFLTISGSPNTSAESRQGRVLDKAAYAYDLALHQPLAHSLSLNAGIGFYDLRNLYGKGYGYWNAGLSYNLGPSQLDLSYIGTDNTAKLLFGNRMAMNQWVATILWRY